MVGDVVDVLSDGSMMFFSYPFDSHEIRLRFSFGPSTDVFTCSQLTAAAGSPLAAATAADQLTLAAGLLPTTKEYAMARSGVRAAQPAGDTSVCDLIIPLTRRYFIVLIKVRRPCL